MENNYPKAAELAPALRMLYAKSTGKNAVAVFCDSAEALRQLAQLTDKGQETPLMLDLNTDIEARYNAYMKEKGASPRLAVLPDTGVFALAATKAKADGILAALEKGSIFAKIPGIIQEIVHAGLPGRMEGKICLVTGGAQGFGEGIVRGIVAQGGYAVIADLNEAGAKALAEELNQAYGAGSAIGVGVNVADEDSVQAMVQDAVLAYGGLDVLVSCAGIAIAGGLAEMTRDKFDKVTAVNYTGFFLCAKHGCVPMKTQHQYAPQQWFDIIEINSKSGLEGSKNNFAYAGSKFGGVGLTQSFALELVEWGIKVNAICPGNLLDGPLWSDPERGLFRQYLEAGKVPGAKTVADVRRFYEAKVPMNRGCTTEDVARAIYYVVEQQYETGQALPVTGGQIMLK